MTDRDTASRLWLYHKPPGLTATGREGDEAEKFLAQLPGDLPRVVAVGSLDRDSEGLLLLTNDEALGERLHAPETGLTGSYRVQVRGTPDPARLARLADGVSVASVNYGPVEAAVDSEGTETWIVLSLQEAKGRDIRRLMLHTGLRALRVVHTRQGPFALGDMQPCGVREVAAADVARLLG